MAENGDAPIYQNGNGKSPAEIAAEIEEQDKKEREERRRQREPPIVFTDSINVIIQNQNFIPFFRFLLLLKLSHSVSFKYFAELIYLFVFIVISMKSYKMNSTRW